MNFEKEFFRAVKLGDAAAVSRYLEAEPGLLHIRDAEQSTPLHSAAWKGQLEIVKMLIAAGADVNARNENDHWGTSPLHAAAHANQAAIAEALIASGAEIEANDRNGKTPMHHTTFHKATAAAKVLRTHGATE